MDEIIETVTIDEQDLTDIGEPTAEEIAGGKVDWEKKYKETAGIAKRRTTALKKAKDALGKIPKVEPKTPKNDQDKKLGELDYGQKAFLNSLGYKDVEDQKYVQQAMKESGKGLEEILAIPFISGELKRLSEERATKAAIPPADNRNGSPARDTVEYWIAKGELPPKDQRELRGKVVKAKIAKLKNSNNFTSTPVA